MHPYSVLSDPRRCRPYLQLRQGLRMDGEAEAAQVPVGQVEQRSLDVYERATVGGVR